jgi:hypothetical protein
MTECRANNDDLISYSNGTFQPEALHPMLKYFSGDSPKDSALVTECDITQYQHSRQLSP